MWKWQEKSSMTTQPWYWSWYILIYGNQLCGPFRSFSLWDALPNRKATVVGPFLYNDRGGEGISKYDICHMDGSVHLSLFDSIRFSNILDRAHRKSGLNKLNLIKNINVEPHMEYFLWSQNWESGTLIFGLVGKWWVLTSIFNLFQSHWPENGGQYHHRQYCVVCDTTHFPTDCLHCKILLVPPFSVLAQSIHCYYRMGPEW